MADRNRAQKHVARARIILHSAERLPVSEVARRATTRSGRPLALRPGAKGIVTDVCVPISCLAECITAVEQDIAEADLLAPMVGHVGDGNFHLIFLVDLDDEAEVARAKAVNARMVGKALALGGTCTGEHGVGSGKIGYLEAEHGAVAVRAMQAIKQALDPDDIMNPGKTVPLDRG